MHLTRDFWKSAAERSIRSAAAAMLALLGAGAVDALKVDWIAVLSVGLGAAIVSVLTSVVASEVGHKGTTFFIEEGK